MPGDIHFFDTKFLDKFISGKLPENFNEELEGYVDNKEFPKSFIELELQTNKLLSFIKV